MSFSFGNTTDRSSGFGGYTLGGAGGGQKPQGGGSGMDLPSNFKLCKDGDENGAKKGDSFTGSFLKTVFGG